MCPRTMTARCLKAGSYKALSSAPQTKLLFVKVSFTSTSDTSILRLRVCKSYMAYDIFSVETKLSKGMHIHGMIVC